MKTEALVQMLKDAPVIKTSRTDVSARILKALEEIPLTDVSLTQIARQSGLSNQTIHYRVRVKWRLQPSRHLAKVFKGESDLYCREEILKKARGEG